MQTGLWDIRLKATLAYGNTLTASKEYNVQQWENRPVQCGNVDHCICYNMHCKKREKTKGVNTLTSSLCSFPWPLVHTFPVFACQPGQWGTWNRKTSRSKVLARNNSQNSSNNTTQAKWCKKQEMYNNFFSETACSLKIFSKISK